MLPWIIENVKLWWSSYVKLYANKVRGVGERGDIFNKSVIRMYSRDRKLQFIAIDLNWNRRKSNILKNCAHSRGFIEGDSFKTIMV